MLTGKEKKYYFLKLEKDYFGTKEIKKLRKVAGGDTFTIIYLKMQLRSLENGGILVYEGIEEDFAEELALDLDEKVENVKVTLSFLQANNMIEQINDYEFFLNRVPETITSETGAAKRMRLHRQRKELEENRNIVTATLQPVTTCYTDIEKELELELEEELAPSDTAPSQPEATMEQIAAEIVTEEPPKIFITLQLIGDKEHSVTEDDISLFKEAYPSVNIEQELRKMKGWLFSNPTKRKTARGINAFINRWLCREQDKGGTYQPRQTNNQRIGNNFYDLMNDEEFMNGGTR